MKVTSTGIENGYWADRFGKHGSDISPQGKAVRSVPFSIIDPPEGTVSFAAILDDPDSIPVCGFKWIHWTLCNLTQTEVPEDISRHNPDFIQGTTSFHSAVSDETIEQASCYGGMAPPDADHAYDLDVYALDCTLDLQPGFYLNEMIHAMRGHVLTHARVTAKYRA